MSLSKMSKMLILYDVVLCEGASVCACASACLCMCACECVCVRVCVCLCVCVCADRYVLYVRSAVCKQLG